MLRSHLYFAFAAAGLLTVNAVGCGDDEGASGGGTTQPAGRQPPARPNGAGPGDGAGVIMGTTKLYIGTKTRAGQEDSKAWMDFGYDLDGQITGASDFSKHCKPSGNAPPKSVFPDGNDGIDNSFGKYLLPIIKTAASAAGGGADLEGDLNQAIAEGDFNVMIDLRQLGAGANYSPIEAHLFAGKNGMGNAWELVPEFFSPPLPTGPVPSPLNSPVRFANSYVTENVWVSGDKGTVNLSLNIAGQSFNLAIGSAIISMQLDPSRGTATNGVIAGVLDTEALVQQVKDIAGPLISCEGTAVDSVLNQLRQGSDIMKDGSQNPNATCDGISIGLGFDAAAVTLSRVGDPADPPEDNCAGGGMGGGGTGGGAN